MRITAKLDTAPVGTYYGQLAAALRQSQPRTIRMEAAATVRKAMQLQPVRPPTAAQISLSARRKAVARFYDGGAIGGSINVSRRRGVPGMAWLVRKDLGRAQPLYLLWDGAGQLPAPVDHQGRGTRVSDANWAKWKAAYSRAIAYARKQEQARLGARGLTQKSWFDLITKIADGEPMNTPALVMRARPVKGGSRTVAAAIAAQTRTSFSLSVVNDSGLAVATGGQRKLNTAISIRRKFFLDSLNKGFLSDASFVARNYKWAAVSG